MTEEAAQLSLTPLGAGDLIDRTIRLYRRHFTTFIRASVPPVIISATGSVLYTVTLRGLALTESGGRLVLYVALSFVGLALILAGYLFHFIVMGGAAHNLVRHLLWKEPVAARTIYRSVRARFWGLLGATLAVFCWVLVALGVAFAALLLCLLVALIIAGLMFGSDMARWPELLLWPLRIASLVGFVVVLYVSQWLFFYLAGRVAYVPQVMLIEGRGVLDSIWRSSALARGNVRRLMAMFWFTISGGFSVLALLAIPLGWYAYLHGIDLDALRNSEVPAWYSISYQLMAQASTILLTPVFMLSLSLLYVDERVRSEGYDVELSAARLYGEMPVLPSGRSSPLAPALVPTPLAPPRAAPPTRPKNSVLGLTDN